MVRLVEVLPEAPLAAADDTQKDEEQPSLAVEMIQAGASRQDDCEVLRSGHVPEEATRWYAAAALESPDTQRGTRAAAVVASRHGDQEEAADAMIPS